MARATNNQEVLIVDDDPVFLQSLRLYLTARQWDCHCTNTVEDAVKALHNREFDLAILDVHLPDGSAVDIVNAAGSTPCLLCTQDDNDVTFSTLLEDEGIAHNLVGYLVKPLSATTVLSIRAGLRIGMERKERARLIAEFNARLEEERRQIAQNLHDSMGAVLTQLTWEFAKLDRAITQAPDVDQMLARVVTSISAKGKGIVQAAHAEVSRLVTDLRPEAVVVSGLKNAIVDMLEQWADTAPTVAFSSKLCSELQQLDQRRIGSIYRLVQEGITNAMRHTDPVSVAVEMVCRNKQLVISVTTKGGIKQERDNYALTSLRERTASLGGKLQFSCNKDAEKSALEIIIPV